jgi:ribose transport system permease protein
MSSQSITKDQVSTTGSLLSRFVLTDWITFVCSLALLIAFLALPWFQQAEVSATGIGLLTGAPSSLPADLKTAVQADQWSFLLIPLAAIIALAALLWGLLKPGTKHFVPQFTRLGGLIGLVYFGIFAVHDRQLGEISLALFSGDGFWISFFAAFVLFIQFFVVRPAPGAQALRVAGTSRVWSGLGRLTGGLTENPRFIRFVIFVFRFQSFFGLIIVFILAIAASPIRSGNNIFMSQRNLSNVTRDVAETGILAVGQILVIIIGGIDLSVGSVVALTATGVAFLLMRDLIPAIPAILIILGLGIGIGWWNGWSAERFKIPSFVTTLAMLSIARGIAHIWSSDIAVPISYGPGGADPLFEVIGERINGIFPVPAIIMFIAALIMWLILQYTSFGRHIYAIGGNPVAARLSGVGVSRVKITAFMLCGFFASMAGIIHAAQLNQGSPNEAVNYELNSIAAVVIGGASLAGGKGTIAGAIAGAFILGILDNMLSLNNVSSSGQLVTKGLLVIGAVALQQFKPRETE